MAVKQYTQAEKEAQRAKLQEVWSDPEKRAALSAKLKVSWTPLKKQRMSFVQGFKWGKFELSQKEFDRQMAVFDKAIADGKTEEIKAASMIVTPKEEEEDEQDS